MDCIHMVQNRDKLVGFCEHNVESSVSTEWREFAE
jgi:hypothetical protein